MIHVAYSLYRSMNTFALPNHMFQNEQLDETSTLCSLYMVYIRYLGFRGYFVEYYGATDILYFFIRTFRKYMCSVHMFVLIYDFKKTESKNRLIYFH